MIISESYILSYILYLVTKSVSHLILETYTVETTSTSLALIMWVIHIMHRHLRTHTQTHTYTHTQPSCAYWNYHCTGCYVMWLVCLHSNEQLHIPLISWLVYTFLWVFIQHRLMCDSITWMIISLITQIVLCIYFPGLYLMSHIPWKLAPL